MRRREEDEEEEERGPRRRILPIVLLPDSTAFPLLALVLQLYWPLVRRALRR